MGVIVALLVLAGLVAVSRSRHHSTPAPQAAATPSAQPASLTPLALPSATQPPVRLGTHTHYFRVNNGGTQTIHVRTPTDVVVFSSDGTSCGVLSGHRLVVGTRVRNLSKAAAVIHSVGLRITPGAVVDSGVGYPCGPFAVHHLAAHGAGYRVPAGSDVWLTVTLRATGSCPPATPLLFDLGVRYRGRNERVEAFGAVQNVVGVPRGCLSGGAGYDRSAATPPR